MLLNQALVMPYRFYGTNSSYVHGGSDPSGKPVDAVYGQKAIHRKVMSQTLPVAALRFAMLKLIAN